MSAAPRVRARKYLAVLLLAWLPFAASAQEDKKTDEDKPADPDTGESTVEEKTLGILPNPLAKYGVKFAATYIGELLGNVSGGLKQGAIYEGRLNLAVDVDLQKLAGLDQLTFHANICFRFMAMVFREIIFRTSSSSVESRLWLRYGSTKLISKRNGAITSFR
jgi:porin